MPLPKDPIKRAVTIEKIRQNTLKQWQNPEKRTRLLTAHKGTLGKKYSKESRKKMSDWQIGRKMSSDARKKMSMAKKGEQSWFIVGDYSFYAPRSRPGHTTWAKKVKERDQCCQLCGSEKQLTAHHLHSHFLHPESRFDITNGMTLCHTHHFLVHAANRLI